MLDVGVGGGAGALVPAISAQLGYENHIPEHAEVISSVGDALSLVRVEVERTIVRDPGPRFMKEIHRSAEEQAVAAGAAPDSLRVTSEAVPERRAVRAVATGSVALQTGAVPGSTAASEEEVWLAAKLELIHAVQSDEWWTDATYSMIDEIRRGTELGKVLGDGAVSVGKAYNIERVPAVKGQAMSGYEPRSIKGTGVTYATTPQGADHTAGIRVAAATPTRKHNGQGR